jgi:hypothetical protein
MFYLHLARLLKSGIQDLFTMKKTTVVCILVLSFFGVNAQYRGGIGVYAGTPAKFSSTDFPVKDSLVYELSIKVFDKENSCYDIIGGLGKDYFNFTLMKEIHNTITYPVDWYLGLGAHVGSWKDNHWNDGAEHKKMFGGVDGTFGLQITFFPFAFTVGMRPSYTLFGGDQFFWYKQVGLRICFR